MSKNRKYSILVIFSAFVALYIYGCSENPPSNSLNQPPNTFLSLFPDSIISPQKTKLKITWWGDDPDGLVKSFEFSFDSLSWTPTDKNDSTFQLNLLGEDSTFRFWVRAVDERGEVDPTPASNLFPVVNTPPSVAFNVGTEIPDTTFPVASFSWFGTDPDGNSTLRYFYWALNDTSNWHRISSTTTLLTLRQDSGIVPNANNKFFLKAEDIAGAYSNVMKMPDTNQVWFVRAKVGRVLLIDDYPSSISDNSYASNFYNTAFDTIQHSTLDIKVGNGANIPTIPNPMFIETMKLFQAVVWYAGRGNGANDNANFSLAQQTIPFYLVSNGKVFFTTGFPNDVGGQSSIVQFAQIDSVTFFQQATTQFGIPTIVIDNNYPELQTGGNSSPERVRGLYPGLGMQRIYKLPYNPSYDTNKITICVKNVVPTTNIVFMGVPLHRMNEANNASVFLKRVINVDFGIN